MYSRFDEIRADDRHFHSDARLFLPPFSPFVFAVIILFILELEHFQPLFKLLDAHALWNFGICPLPLLWYSFAIDDSFYLYREMSAYKIE